MRHPYVSGFYAQRIVEAALLVSELERRMTFVDGSSAVHDLLSGHASMSRDLTTFLRGRVYYGKPCAEGEGTPATSGDLRGTRFTWVVCAVDGVT